MQIHMYKDLIEKDMKHKQQEIGYYIEEMIYQHIIEEKDLEDGLDQLNLVSDYSIIEFIQQDLNLIH